MLRGRSLVLSLMAVVGLVFVGLPQAARAQTKLKPGQCCPVKVKKSGSYILTGNLEPNNPNTDAIEVSASNVTIDLGGYSIVGPNKTSGSGIGVDALSQTNVTVENGTVTGMSGSGVAVGSYGIVKNVQSTNNGNGGSGAGIQCTGASCLVENCVSSANANGAGLSFIDTTSGYTGNVIQGNLSTVVGGVSIGNGGISAAPGSNVCNGSPLCP